MHNSEIPGSRKPGAPRKTRRYRPIGELRRFKPAGIPGSELKRQILHIDEFEAMRLCDLENLSQIEAAETMEVSRGTVQRLLLSGRAKVAGAILRGEMIILDEGEENDE
ncbi:hypothetical protein B4O97_04885 [Marispirochaeta aestuarii]|uniref:UPF0251 protein B4O97_04885 n=1 Tax=Marispirochaeta aestuarii TaxID=1963862 RepID=A0A1Y1S0S3_9SPIO|nr:DUF134 domain-containing protein [Marispirochaeta aestuarii]ORC36963.1 hypothetical protein B4O97_04885 [Marispirochaeta aestuarii]